MSLQKYFTKFHTQISGGSKLTTTVTYHKQHYFRMLKFPMISKFTLVFFGSVAEGLCFINSSPDYNWNYTSVYYHSRLVNIQSYFMNVIFDRHLIRSWPDPERHFLLYSEKTISFWLESLYLIFNDLICTNRCFSIVECFCFCKKESNCHYGLLFVALAQNSFDKVSGTIIATCKVSVIIITWSTTSSSWPWRCRGTMTWGRASVSC